MRPGKEQTLSRFRGEIASHETAGRAAIYTPWMDEVEVLVVGAGPAGSTAAYGLARRGHDVLVVEEHSRVGHPVQCAGLVSDRVLALAGDRSFVRTTVRGATVLSPSLRPLSFAAEEPRAHVIDRAGLDEHLANRAARAGARFATATKFVRRSASRGTAGAVDLVDTEGRTQSLRPRLVIGADGVASAVARGFRLRRPVEILPAFEAEYGDSPGNPDEVEVYLGRRVAPGLFGWWIPDGQGGGRLGVASEAKGTTARKYYERLLEQFATRHGRQPRSLTQYIVSGIPIGSVPRLSADGVLLVGDAAAQVKPLSGGGIFTGMRAGEIASEIAHRGLTGDDISAAALAEYDRAWRNEMGPEFERALYLRRIFSRLTDDDLERLVEALQGAELLRSIVAFGDIDFPSRVAWQLFRQSPSLVRLLPKAVSAFFSGPASRVPDLDL